MTTQLYRKAERADDIADLDLKDAEPVAIMEATYKVWLSATDDLRATNDREKVGDALYQEAHRIVRPFKERITGALNTCSLPFLDTKNSFVGLYLSALINATDLKKLSIGNESNWEAGYRLGTGKIVEVLKDCSVLWLGPLAEGGMLVNDGTSQGPMGSLASGGVLINNAEIGTWGMAEHASGGVFVNKGRATSMGDEATGGVFFNYNHISSMGSGAKGGTFVTNEKYSSMPIGHIGNDAYGIRPDDLAKDSALSAMVDRIKRLSKEKKAVKIEALARKIDGHIRKNYRSMLERYLE